MLDDNVEVIPDHLVPRAARIRELVGNPQLLADFRSRILRSFQARSDRLALIRKWREDWDAHADRLLGRFPESDPSAHPPEGNWRLQTFPPRYSYVAASRLCDRKTIAVPVEEHDAVSGWTPPHLLGANEPEDDLPLPLPDKPLSVDDQCVVLAAVYDAVYRGVEPIHPWAGEPPDDDKEAARFAAEQHVYAGLVGEARRMPLSHAVSVDAMIDTVTTALSEGEGRKRRRGRPVETDANADRHVYEAWKTGQYPTFADLARELGVKEREVRLAIDRHEKRLSKS